MKNQYLIQVTEFHETFKHPVLLEPQIPDSKRCDLRTKLISEELDELKEAIKSNDIVLIADALCDLQYVLSGTVLEFGFGDLFAQLFNEVHRSNMSKACKSESEANETIKANCEDCYTVNENDKWMIYRKSDNKTVKCINYSPADLKSILC